MLGSNQTRLVARPLSVLIVSVVALPVGPMGLPHSLAGASRSGVFPRPFRSGGIDRGGGVLLGFFDHDRLGGAGRRRLPKDVVLDG